MPDISLYYPLFETAVFYLLALVVLIGAGGVVFSKNVVHSALSLTISFLGIGALYLYMGADFLGAVQIMVYGGAVAILIVIAIMLTRREDMAHSNLSHGIFIKLGAGILALCFVLLLSATALLSQTDAKLVDGIKTADSVTLLADLMLQTHILPFEIAAILLLVAMLGAIILAKGEET